MTDPTNDFSRPAIKVADCMAVVSCLPGVSLDAPDFLLIRSRDLKYLLDLSTDNRVLRSVTRLLNSSESLQDFLSKHHLLIAKFAEKSKQAAAVGLACDGTPPAAGVPELVTPPSNTGVNKILSLAQGIK